MSDREINQAGAVDLLKEHFIRYLKYNISSLGLFEFGIDKSIFDLMIFNAHRQYFRGFEFKRTRRDFLNDINKAKWVKYLEYCNTFTWVCPPEIIYPNEVISPCGLLWINADIEYKHWDGSSYIHKGNVWKRKPKGLKLSQESLNRILCLFVNRFKFRKDDFY